MKKRKKSLPTPQTFTCSKSYYAMFLIITVLFTHLGFASPINPHVNIAEQWHFTGNRHVGTGVDATDWVYDILPTSKKEYVVCGYTTIHYFVGTDRKYTIVPAFLKLDNMGRIIWFKYFGGVSSLNSDENSDLNLHRFGVLWQVVESDKLNHYYTAVGYMNNDNDKPRLLIVEFDENGNYINGTPKLKNLTGNTNDDFHGYSLTMDPTGTNYIIGGQAGLTGTGISVTKPGMICKLSHSSLGVVGSVYYGGNSSGVNQIQRVVTNVPPLSSTTTVPYKIFGAGFKSVNHGTYADGTVITATNANGLDNAIIREKDMWLVGVDNALTNIFDVTYQKSNLNSIVYTEAGPVTARNVASTGIGLTSYLCHGYFNDAVNNDERLNDLIYINDGSANGKLAAVGIVNGIYIRDYLEGNGSHLIQANGEVYDASRWYSYDEYMDGDLYLLKADAGNGSITATNCYNKNVGHYSSKDFTPRIVQADNGHFIIAGSSADYYTGSSDVDPVSYYSALITETPDAPNTGSTPDHIWRRTAKAHSEDNICLFALAKTLDGGIIIGGDNTVSATNDNFSITKFAPACAPRINYYNYSGEHIVSGTETWGTSTKTIAARVVVPAGQKLVINNCTVSFASSEHMYDYYEFPGNSSNGTQIGIIVQPGGELDINNSTLQGINSCGRRMMWDGIVVQGNKGAPPTSSNQGVIKISNNSVIKDARIGLMVANAQRDFATQVAPASPAYSGLETTTWSSRYNSYGSNSGGIVTANSSTFKNCRFSVNFQDYPTPGTTSGSFIGCNFLCDDDMADIYLYSYPDGSPMPSDNFVSAWNMNKLLFLDNTFRCDTKYPYAHRPMGIFLADAGGRVEASCTVLDAYGNCIGTKGSGNLFQNLSYGVNALRSPAKMALQMVVSENTFDNNGRATSVSGSIGTSINRNTYKVPGNTNGYPAYPMGVQVESSYSYAVEGNSFTNCTGCTPIPPNSTGIVINNQHGNDEVVRKNTLDNIKYGCFSQLNNSGASASGTATGLQWRCNDFSPNMRWDILRTSHADGPNGVTLTVPATIRQNQGDPLPAPSANAGNRFYNSCTTSDNFLAADGNSTQGVVYFYPSSTGNYDPTFCKNILYFPTNTGSPSDHNSVCPNITSGTGGSASIAGMRDNLKTYDTYIAGSVGEDPNLAYYYTARNLQVNELSRCYAGLDMLDSAAYLMEYYGRYAEAIEYFMAAGLWLKAYNDLSLLPTATSDDNNFKWLCKKALDLYSTNQTWYDMDSTARDSVYSLIAYNNNPGTLAYTVSTLLNEESFIYLSPVISPGWAKQGITGNANSSNSMAAAQENMIFTMYPNPTTGEFTINSSVNGILKLYSIDGREVSSFAIAEGKNAMTLQSGLNPGVYLGKMFAGDKQLQVIRVIYKP